MFNSSVVDVCIGLIFTYLILGLICTTANEWLAQFWKMRAKTLKEGIANLLSEPQSLQIDAANLVKILATSHLANVLGVDAAEIQSRLASGDRAVVGELTAAIKAAVEDPRLFQKIDLAGVESSVLTAAKKASAGSLVQANYALLSQAYPQAIAQAETLQSKLYAHPLIASLSRPGEHPSYIPAPAFAAAIINILGANAADIKSSIDAMPDCDVRRALQFFLQSTGQDLSAFQKNIEQWFENTMDRVSGWYKTKIQIVTVVVAVGVTIFANADTVQIARSLYLNPVLRAKIVGEAGVAAKSDGHILTPAEKADLGELTGWSSEFKTFHRLEAQSENPAAVAEAASNDSFPGLDLVKKPALLGSWLWAIVPVHLLGWLLTAVAASLGAPFWFDTLNKFMNIRAAGTSPNEKGKDQSKL
jgi:hypothetical protein